MGTTTIDIRDDVYERLHARKRDDESFSDLVARLLDDTIPDWREGFGMLPPEEADDLEQIDSKSRMTMNEGAGDVSGRTFR